MKKLKLKTYKVLNMSSTAHRIWCLSKNYFDQEIENNPILNFRLKFCIRKNKLT